MSTVRPVPKPLNRPLRLGVLISGGGRTLVNFARQINEGRLNAEIPIVIADRDDCSGIARAEDAGLNVHVVSRRQFPTIEAFSTVVFDCLRDAEVDLVTLAGFLSLIRIPPDFQFRVMNIHPALIPSFCGTGLYGDKVHRAAIERGVKVSGCTVHFADNEYDHGPIILQRAVPVLDDDTPDTLAARVFQVECEVYPQAVRQFVEGRIEIRDGRVRILPSRPS